MTLQEIFTTAVKGLRAQGYEKSVLPTGAACAYRGEAGRKCAIGHCIPDSKYSLYIEYRGAADLEVRQALGWPSSRYADYLPLVALQKCHDRAGSPKDMELRLRDFGTYHNLVWPGVE